MRRDKEKRSKKPAWAPYLESIVVLGIIASVNLLWFKENWGFLETEPHPFWILIIAVPLMYGVHVGTFTGVVSLMAHLAFQATQESLPLDLTTPSLMLASAIFIGEIRQRSLTKWEEALQENNYLKDALNALRIRLQEGDESASLLRRQVLGHTKTFSRMCEIGKRMIALDEKEVAQAAAELTAKFLDAEVVSILLYQRGEVSLAATYPPGASSGVSSEILTTSPVLRKCLEEVRTISLRDVMEHIMLLTYDFVSD